MTKRAATRAAARSARADPPPTLLSLPTALLEDVLGLQNLHNCLVAMHVNQRLRRVALDVVVGRAADPHTLCTAAVMGRTLAVRALLQAGAAVDAAGARNSPPAAWASKTNNVAVLHLLADAGADINKANTDYGGLVALHHAAMDGHLEAVQFLLDSGADAGAIYVNEDDERMSTLDMAVQCGRCEVVRLLLAAGVSPHLMAHHDHISLPPLLRATFRGDLEVVNVLLGAGTDPNHPFPPTSTPLCMAVRVRRCDIAASLLQHGADVNDGMANGTLPLHHAAITKNAAMVRLLLIHGASIEACGPQEWTPLMFAVVGGHLETVQALLNAGSRMDARSDAHGSSALHYAATFGNLDVVNALLAAGASCAHRNAPGWTALQRAEQAGHAAVAAALRAAGA